MLGSTGSACQGSAPLLALPATGRSGHFELEGCGFDPSGDYVAADSANHIKRQGKLPAEVWTCNPSGLLPKKSVRAAGETQPELIYPPNTSTVGGRPTLNTG